MKAVEKTAAFLKGIKKNTKAHLVIVGHFLFSSFAGTSG
jgi:hypothetical protein